MSLTALAAVIGDTVKIDAPLNPRHKWTGLLVGRNRQRVLIDFGKRRGCHWHHVDEVMP